MASLLLGKRSRDAPPAPRRVSTRSRGQPSPAKAPTVRDPIFSPINKDLLSPSSAKTPSPRAEPEGSSGPGIAQHGRLYQCKNAFDLVYAQKSKEFYKPALETYPKLADPVWKYAEAAPKPMHLDLIRENIGLGNYNANPEGILEDTKLVFESKSLSRIHTSTRPYVHPRHLVERLHRSG